MKHLVSFNIFESVMDLDDIYNKYYRNQMNRDIFRVIISYDPTSRPNKLGKYSKWLLNLYDLKKENLEDFYKATEYLKLYDRFKHTLPIEKRNINNIVSLPVLARIIEPFEEPAPELLSSDENKKKAFVKSFKNFDLYIPTTYEQSRDLGRGTKWCTAADSKDGEATFFHYNNKGTIYILISKKDTREKYQFHFEEGQFMDRYDSGIHLLTFMDNHPDIKEYFKVRIHEILKFLEFDTFEERKIDDIPDRTFYLKDGVIAMEKDDRNNVVWVGAKIFKICTLYANRLQMTDITKMINQKMSDKLEIKLARFMERRGWIGVQEILDEERNSI